MDLIKTVNVMSGVFQNDGMKIDDGVSMALRTASTIIMDCNLLAIFIIVSIFVLVMNFVINNNHNIENRMRKFDFFKLFFYSLLVYVILSWTVIYSPILLYVNPFISVMIAAFGLTMFDY